MKINNGLFKMIISSLFLALACIMPFLTGHIPEIGSMLCPMHIPVILCGFFCGRSWGGAVGFTAPVLRSFILGVPPLFPTALCMAFELAVYGFVSGFLYNRLPKKKLNVYLSLFAAMISGRLVWGAVMFVCMGLSTEAFSFETFVVGAFTNAVPGIVLQILIIPVLVFCFYNSKLLNITD